MSTAVEWLCEHSQPAVRYRAMLHLSGAPASSESPESIYHSIWQLDPVKKMLERQNSDGIWEHSEKEYGVHTSLRYLTAFAEFGLRKDDRLDRTIAYTVDFLNEQENADLRHDYSGCSNALVLRALVMLGYHQDQGVVNLLEKYAAAQLDDGGFICRRLLAKRPARRSCYKAGLAALLLYAECKQKNINLPGTEKLLEYFLKRDVFFDSQSKSRLLPDGTFGWRGVDNFFPVEPMRIGLPMTMAALAVLGVSDHPAMCRAWAFLDNKRCTDGRYLLEGTLTKQPCKFGAVGAENKWVTFYALLANQYRHIDERIPA